MKKNSFWLAFCLFYWAGVCALSAQQGLQTEYYSVDDGLSERLITDIAIGKEGFFWLATENGLNRFDGYDFTVFNSFTKDKNKNWLSSNNIKNIFPTQSGELVVLYNNNLSSFDIFNTETHENRAISLLPEFGIHGIVRNVHVDKKGAIFVITANQSGLAVYEFDGDKHFNQVFELSAAYVNPSIQVELLHTQEDKFFIFDSEKGLRLLNRRGRLLRVFGLERFECWDNPQGDMPSTIYFLHEDHFGQVWMSFYGIPGVFRYDKHAMMFERPSTLDQEKIYSKIWEDWEGNLLLANTRGSGVFPPLLGLYCFSKEGVFHDFSALIMANRGVISIAGRNFFKCLFLAMDTGFKIVPNTHSPVKNYLSENLSEDQRGAVIRGITANKDYVYFAREVNKWYGIEKHSGQLDTIALIDELTGEPLEFSCGMDVKLDASGMLWGITCYKSTFGQLHRMDLATKTVKTFRYDYLFNAFTIDQHGIIWLGCTIADQKGQLISFDPQTGRFSPFVNKENKNILEDAIPRFIKESKDGFLWVGTENGLFRVDRKNRDCRVFKADQNMKKNKALNDNVVYVIEEAPDGKILLGTKNGLNVLDPRTNDVQFFTKSNGLASNTVCGIIPDDEGNYWISTFNGLSFFNYEKQTFHNFYASDGFSHDEFNRFSFYRDKANDRLYFGGVNGMNVFSPKDILVGKDVPQPVLTKIIRHNNNLDSVIIQDEDFSTLKELLIESSDAYFSIHFALPPTIHAKRNQFKIKLEGMDEKWVYLGNTPYVIYNRLPAGDYVLLVKGADANGNWSEQDLRLPIRVKQVFYKTWWFLFLLTMSLVLLGNWIFRSQLEQRLKVERLRTKLSSDLHDELSGLLSGIAMQAEMLELQSQEEDMRNRLQAIGEVSRKAMSKMSDVIWSIDSRKDRFSDLILRMQEHASEILSPLDIGYEFQISKLEVEQKIPVPIRQDLYFIFKEAINNVAKHSNASMVTIQLTNAGPFFEMSIKDNGTKLTEASAPSKVNNGAVSKKTGQGLSNLKMRAERLKAELNIDAQSGFSIYLKAKRID